MNFYSYIHIFIYLYSYIYIIILLYFYIFILLYFYIFFYKDAYILVHSFAVLKYNSGFTFKIFAISGTSGSFGFGSDNNEQIDNNILDIVNAGLH